jgi:hypothetical protein
MNKLNLQVRFTFNHLKLDVISGGNCEIMDAYQNLQQNYSDVIIKYS